MCQVRLQVLARTGMATKELNDGRTAILALRNMSSYVGIDKMTPEEEVAMWLLSGGTMCVACKIQPRLPGRDVMHCNICGTMGEYQCPHFVIDETTPMWATFDCKHRKIAGMNDSL